MTAPEQARFPVGIVGTRDHYPDDEVLATIRRFGEKHPEGIVVVTGDAKGVDEIAAGWARAENVPFIAEPAHWAEQGKAAGHERNARVVARCSAVVAFFHPKPLVGLPTTSPGTCDAITQARDRHIPVYAHHEARWLADGDLQRIADQVHQKWARVGKAPEKQEDPG